MGILSGSRYLGLSQTRPCLQQVIDFTERQWLAQQESLHLRTTLRADCLQLFRGLHALCCTRHAKSPSHGRDCAHDIERTQRCRDILHKGAVDLDFVEWKAAQIAK